MLVYRVRMAHFIRDFVVRWQRVVLLCFDRAPNPGFARAVLSLEVDVDRRIFHRIRFARDFETGSRYGRYFGGYVCGRTK
jgi:hypothetical protein